MKPIVVYRRYNELDGVIVIAIVEKSGEFGRFWLKTWKNGKLWDIITADELKAVYRYFRQKTRHR